MNFGFIIDNRKCIGCHACTVACKAEHDVAIGVNRTWVKYIEKGEFPHTRRLFSVMRCNHCEDAPCVEICPVTALFKRDDGIVDFDNRRCKGCMQACPYDALYIDPNTHTAAKCNYCAHRVDIGLEPACVNVCPEHAIISGDMDDPFSEISQLLGREQVTARKVEKGTRPKLFYIEGDEASLKPIVTAQESSYVWSSQATGVGHFAHYAEARMSSADPAKMAELLKGREGEWVSGREKDSEKVLVPSDGDEKKMHQKAEAVVREKARRVYDAPGKGVLWGWEVSAYVWTKAIASGAFLIPFLATFVVAPSGADPEGSTTKGVDPEGSTTKGVDPEGSTTKGANNHHARQLQEIPMHRRKALQKMLQAIAGFVAMSSGLPAKLFAKTTQPSAPFAGNALRLPAVISSGTALTLAQANVTVWPNTTTQVYAINNSYPAPMIRVQKGQTFTAEFHNQLDQPATIHWHGLIVPENMDGHPKDPVPPGGSYTYTFPIIQKAGTYFYHAHADQRTALQVYKGFAGFFIIDDPDEAKLGLPTGNYDVPLVIQDRRAATKPQFTYNPNMMEVMDGYLGDVALVNGTPEAYLEVSRTLYRFRILNGSNARVYKLAFSDNRAFYVIGTDGGLIDAPVQVTESLLAPGERLDILVDFSPDQLGQNVYLKSLPFTAGGAGTTYRQGVEMNLLRFDVVRSESSGGKVPASLTPIAYYNPNDALRTRTFLLTMQMGMAGMHRINNKVFEMNRIDETVPLRELEKWQIVNNTDEFHPMHVHGIQFQVLDRSGNRNLAPVDKGWKDTVLVNPNETVNLLVRFDTYAGIYLLHCHNLEHEDDGMMLNLQVTQTTGVKDETPLPQRYGLLHQNHPNPFTHATTLRYEIATPQPASVDLRVYDHLGRQVAVLVQKQQSPGIYEVPFRGDRLPAGVYFVKLNVTGFVYSQNIILVK